LKQSASIVPRPTPIDTLSVGEVGFITASIKTVADVQIGDTITEAARPVDSRFPVFRKSNRWFSRSLPDRFGAIRRLARRDGKTAPQRRFVFLRAGKLDRARFSVSAAAFSGLLHMEIVQESFEREFNLDLITTAPACVTA
jgi:GTP-binding protein LepA